MSRYPHTILATCCVPWTERGELDEPVFRDGIRILLDHHIRHLYLFGTAGEGYAVSDRQFDEIVEVFAQEMEAPLSRPMVGIISLSLSTVIERIERCADRGLAAFQVSLPSWGGLNDEEMARFFAETCGRFPGLNFLHYNLPRSRRMMTPSEYAVLAEQYPNLVATKNAGADMSTAVALVQQTPQLRHFFTEPGFCWASQFGDVGLLLSIASINLTLAHEYFAAGANRDVATLTSMALELADMTAQLVAELSSARIDGAYDKCYNKVLDERFPLRLLPPYSGASDAEFAAFIAGVRAKHPRWLLGR